MTDKNCVLLVDGMNIFIRSYVANPTLSPNGDPIGGVIGFLQTLQKNIKLIGPKRIKDIYILWDGPNGSRKRKSYNREYKADRKAPRLNRPILELDEKSEIRNRVDQQQRLVEYLGALGLRQLMFEYSEADDLVSYLNFHEKLKDDKKIILSSDTDFFQLCSPQTVILQPYGEKLITASFLISEYGIAAHNFALARSVAGDSSDHLKGIKGVGLKTIGQRLPQMASENTLTIEGLLEVCREAGKTSKLKCFEQIIAGEQIIKRNYRVMALYVPMISLATKEKIERELDSPKAEYDSEEFRRLLTSDGLLTQNLTTLIITAKSLK